MNTIKVWTCHICGIKRRSRPCDQCGACKGCCEVWTPMSTATIPNRQSEG